MKGQAIYIIAKALVDGKEVATSQALPFHAKISDDFSLFFDDARKLLNTADGGYVDFFLRLGEDLVFPNGFVSDLARALDYEPVRYYTNAELLKHLLMDWRYVRVRVANLEGRVRIILPIEVSVDR